MGTCVSVGTIVSVGTAGAGVRTSAGGSGAEEAAVTVTEAGAVEEGGGKMGATLEGRNGDS